MRKASITPFCALCLMFIASFLFVLLESVRVYGLDYYATLKAEAGMDSVCAEYQPLLWQQYGLLVLDGAYGTEYFSEEYMTEQLTKNIAMQTSEIEQSYHQHGLDLFRISLSEAELKGYALLTDGQGELFLNFVAERMKEKLPIGIAQDIYELYQSGMELENASLETVINNAAQTLQWAKASKWAEIDAKINAAETEEEEDAARAEAWVLDSPYIKALEESFAWVGNVRSSGIFKILFEDTAHISVKVSKPASDLATREKVEGTLQYEGNTDWYRKVLVLAYLDDYFSCYMKPEKEHLLSYEMEYVLSGKDTEWQNLESALQKMLLVREAANFTYLLQDSMRVQQAEELARAVGLLIGENPVIVEVIQVGILAAWAYGESILDVRALIAGEKIPIKKTSDEWTFEITKLLSLFNKETKAKPCAEGLEYKDYLKLLLFIENDKTLAFRMMEVMEMSLQADLDYKNCRMNQMIVAMQYQLHFESNPIFFSLVSIGDTYTGKFHFVKDELRSFIP